MNECARCGKPQSELPEEVLPESEEPVQRFKLYDDQRSLYICHDCFDVYELLLPLATQYPMLKDMPDLLEQVRAQVPAEETPFFKKLLPLGQL